MSELTVGTISGLAANNYVVDVAAGSTLNLSAGAVLPSGSIVAVKEAIKTDVFSASVAAGGSVTVPGLTIDHSVSSVGNKIILFSYVYGGWAPNANNEMTVRLQANGTNIVVGDANGSRNRVTGSNAGGAGRSHATINNAISYIPLDNQSVTYSVAVGHFGSATYTTYVNRTYTDDDTVNTQLPVSSLILMEIAQ